MTIKLNWIEIPASDHARAIKFYSLVLNTHIEAGETMGMPYSFLPNGIGAITSSEHIRPDGNGITVYVHVDDLETALMKVTEGGGQVIVPKSPLGEDGFFAVVFDSEGNRVGFHSQS